MSITIVVMLRQVKDVVLEVSMMFKVSIKLELKEQQYIQCIV